MTNIWTLKYSVSTLPLNFYLHDLFFILINMLINGLTSIVTIDGVINVVTSSRSNTAQVGQVLCESPLVAGLSFTGSTNVGKILYRQSAGTVKRLGLELGGNAAFIVFESADLDLAVAGCMASKVGSKIIQYLNLHYLSLVSKCWSDLCEHQQGFGSRICG